MRFYARTGRIPAITTESGLRLFLAEDVDRLARELQERRAKRSGSFGAVIADGEGRE